MQLDSSEWPKKGQIKFQDVELRYRDNTDLVLKKLSFDINPGIKVGVVGRTGAGKSTISMALSRLVELCGGKIEIDGVDISKINLSLLRQSITFIPQDPCLFTGTLRYNIDPFNQYSEAEIESFARSAGLGDILTRKQTAEMIQPSRRMFKKKKRAKKLKKTDSASNMLSKEALDSIAKGGIHFWIAENGSNLSVGERQLVCFCRAILRKSKIVMLDEATANIDVITEQQIQKMIQEEFRFATVLTIAHRLNTIINCDRVLVLDDGKCIEYDSPKALLANKKSRFYSLVEELKQTK